MEKEKMKHEVNDYRGPVTERTSVELEQSLCAVASGKEAKIKAEESEVKVEKYTTIENDVAFD